MLSATTEEPPMQKTLIDTTVPAASTGPQSQDNWLDIQTLANVEITSEDSLFPIEHALNETASTGWRASAKGPQIIRLNFIKPTPIRRIQLHFVDREADRSQEFAIYARSEGGELREVIRQQFTFCPGGANEEAEDYTVALTAVTSLELRIDPDRAHDPTHSQHFAALQSLRLA
jgi:hypothetical protein